MFRPLERGSDLDDTRIIEIQARHCPARFGSPGLFLDGDGAAPPIELDDAVAAWIGAQAYIIAADFVAGGNSALILGEGYRICCPEEVAFRKGFISRHDLLRLGRELEQSDYGRYLLAIAEGEPSHSAPHD
jgi:hypothetical protein